MMDFGDKRVWTGTHDEPLRTSFWEATVPVVMMNFGDRGVFVRIPFHPDTLFSGLSMRDVPAF